MLPMLPPPRQPSNRDIMTAIAGLATKKDLESVRLECVGEICELRGRVDAKLEDQDKKVAAAEAQVSSWKTKAWAVAAGLGPLAIAGAAKAAEWFKGD